MRRARRGGGPGALGRTVARAGAGRGGKRDPDRRGGALALALTAGRDPGEESLIDVTLKGQFEMDRLDVAALRRYRAVLLANVGAFSQYFSGLIENFVRDGGGLFIAVGDSVDVKEYNRLFDGKRGLMPALLGPSKTAGKEPLHPSFPAGSAGAVLEIFDLTRTRVLNDVRVDKFLACRPAENAVRIASFGDEPFLLAKDCGLGRVILWTTTVNQAWTNFPITQDFVPLVQNLAVYLAASRRTPHNLAQGETLIHSSSESRAADPEASRPVSAGSCRSPSRTPRTKRS